MKNRDYSFDPDIDPVFPPRHQQIVYTDLENDDITVFWGWSETDELIHDIAKKSFEIVEKLI